MTTTTNTITAAQKPELGGQLIAVLYARGRAAIYTNPVIGLLSVLVLADKMHASWLAAWFVLLCLHALGRYALVARYERVQPPASEAQRWGRYMAIATTTSGILWGVVAIVVFAVLPPDITSAIFFLCVFTGYAAASVASHAPYLPASYGYLGTLLSLTAIGFFLREGGPDFGFAAAALIFLAANILWARNAHATLVESIALRFENTYLIEELKQKKIEAENANIAKSKFLAAASHDLRQPLHALTLFVSALDERVRAPEVRGIVNNINASVDALQKLFNGLLDVSRLDAGVIQPQVADFRLRALVNLLRNDFEPESREKGLVFHCEVDDVVVRSDMQLLERILRNYLSNAIRYTEHGNVALRASHVDGTISIEVADTGKGIPRSQYQEIFREFHQLDNPERDRNKGLGLGLAIVERLARLLDHPIGLDSEPGRGSVFRVCAPVGDADMVALPPAEAETVTNLSGLRVLVIDDESSVREGMRTLLEQWGCELLLAASQDDAVALLSSRGIAPDVIVADYRLRDNDTGVQAIRRIQREWGSDIPALIVTGDTAPDRLREVSASGYQLLHKPIPPARLRAFLNNVKAGRPIKQPEQIKKSE